MILCFQRPSECCTGTSLIDMSALAACKAKYPEPAETATDKDSEKSRRGRNGSGSCVMECYFNQTNVYKNGAFVKATGVSVLGKSLDAAMKKVLATSIDTCLAQQEEFKKMFKDGKLGKSSSRGGDNKKEKKNDKPRCNPEGHFLLRCIESDMFKNCPADKKVATEDCAALTTYMDKCKFEKKN